MRRVEYGEPDEYRPPFEAGDLRVDFESQRVFLSGQEIHLTSKEYHLLRELVEHAGQVLMPEYLLERVWGLGYEGEDLLLRQVIHRLRRKIEPDPGSPQRIETRIGMGYVFIPHE